MNNFLSYLACFCLAALTLPAAAVASSTNQTKINIPDQVQVGHTRLSPGDYKVEWSTPGPRVNVTFIQGKKQVATVPAILKLHDSQVNQNDVVTAGSGGKQVLREIDIEHNKEALFFGRRG